MITSAGNIARRARAANRISAGSAFATKPRRELAEAMNRADSNRRISARYDAAGDTDEFANYWAQADRLDADSANSRAVRSKMVSRARYESESNGITDGIIQTHANYVVSKGPTLRMQTGSTGFNRMIEREWERWAKTINLRRKLYCMAQAKTQDGEAFGVLRTNPGLKSRVKLDLMLIETEQCQTPYPTIMEFGYIDGIKFDSFGNVQHYDILKSHPGGQSWWNATFNEAEQVPAKFVVHWFALRRPGQHRAVPELRSSMNVGASSRRMREATVNAVETAARLGAALIKQPAGSVIEEIAAGSSIELKPRQMTMLPGGAEAMQMKSEFPNATFKDFMRSQVSEQGRPISMPHNLAASDSSDHNFASGRLDFIPYYMQVDTVRADGDDCVLDPMFAVWYSEAAREFGWVGDPDSPPAHSWDWTPHPVADQEADVNAKSKALQTGQLSFDRLYASAGLDFDDELPILANNYFGDDEESGMSQIERNKAMRELLRNSTFNLQGQQASIKQAENSAASQAAKTNTPTSADAAFMDAAFISAIACEVAKQVTATKPPEPATSI